MFDSLPKPAREILWRLKHAISRRAQAAKLVDYHQGVLSEMLQITRADIALDVGANTGQYARTLRRVGFRGNIVSFEPIPANLSVLRPQAVADGRWEVLGKAIGVQTGIAQFNCMVESTFSSLLSPNDFARKVFAEASEVSSVIDVEVVRLDSVALPTGNSIHLKVDTQGTDLSVVKSATGLLPRISSLSIEIGLSTLYDGQESHLDVLQELDALGFVIAGVFPVGRDRLLRVIDADFLFVRKGTSAQPH